MELLEYRFYGLSEKGKRQKNEDAILTLRLNEDSYFFAVADGMGGVRGGEIASNLVLTKIKDYLENLIKKEDFSCDDLKKIIAELFEIAQDSIRNYIASNPDFKGMGTTLSSLLIHKNKYVWGSVGDSRIYLIHGHNVVRYTRDHTLLEDSSHENFSTNNINMPVQYMHALTRVVDGGDSKPDVFPADEPWFRMDKDSVWILCSDGLIIDKQQNYNQLLLKHAEKAEDPKVMCKSLVDYALQNGSTDNVSVVVVKVKEKFSGDYAPTQKLQSLSLPKESSGLSIKKAFFIALTLLIIISLLFFLARNTNVFGITNCFSLKDSQHYSASHVSQYGGSWYLKTPETLL